MKRILLVFFLYFLFISLLMAEEALFSVTNNSVPPDTIFAVYPSGIKVLGEDGEAVMIANRDSIRMYFDATPIPGRASRGGFAVGGVASRSLTEYLRVTQDSVRVYVDDNPDRSSRGGFAVGGVASRTNASYFDVTPSGTPEIISPSEPRLLWYPTKEAFRVGRVLITDPDSVGTNSIATGFESKAIGDWSQALGYQARAFGDYSTAIGYRANAANDHSFAFGDYSEAYGEDSFALGFGAKALGNGSFAFGSFPRDSLGNVLPGSEATISSGDYSISFGLGSHSTELGAVSLGINTEATGYCSFSSGRATLASGSSSTAFGRSTTASGYASTALGNYSEASGGSSLSAGQLSTASGDYSIALGRHATATGLSAVALGEYTNANGDYSFSAGRSGDANGMNSISIGVDNLADNYYSFAAGRNCNSLGLASIAMGIYCDAENDYSIAIGDNCSATDIYGIAIGTYASADSSYAIAMGRNATAGGFGAFALGYGAVASGGYSLASNRFSEASGEYSTAMTSATASGDYTFAVGRDAEATANYGIAIGYSTVASNGYATAIGYNCTASGNTSFAFGDNAEATGSGCFAIGSDVISEGSGNFAIGENIETGSMGGCMLMGDSSYGTALSANAMNQFKTRYKGGYTFHTDDVYTEIETFYIKNNVDVGIGKENPYHRLHIVDERANSSGTDGSFIDIENLENTSGTLSGIRFKNGAATDVFKGAILYRDITSYGRGDMIFANRNTDNATNVTIADAQMIIRYNGNVGVGTTTPSYKFQVNGEAYASGGWSEPSDRRLKENITTIESALQKVDRLRGVQFQWKDKERFNNGNNIGLIAQEVEEVIPEIVNNKDDQYSIKYAQLTALLIEAVKELKAQNEDLQEQILELKK